MTEAKRAFLREATGLVREAGAIDLLTLASLNISWGLSAMWLILWGPYYGPGGDLAQSVVITTALMFFGSLAWAFLASIMPRSGGDFIFNSRALHPLLGFLSSFGWVCVNFMWCGILGAYVADPALSLMFSTLGYDAAAQFVSSSWGIFTVTTVVIWGETLILMFGLKPMLRFQLVMFAFGILMFLLVWALMGSVTHEQFVAGWNAVSARYGSGDYQTIIDSTSAYLKESYGIVAAPSFASTMAILPVAFWGLGYPYLASYLAGETKKVHRSVLIGVPGALILCAIFWLITIWTIQSKVGYEFLLSVSYAYGDGLEVYALPFPPMFHLFPLVITDNVLLIFLLGWGFVCWNLIYPAYSILPQARIGLAWAIDRLAPPFFADIHPRFRTPIKSMILFAIGGEIIAVIYAFYGYLLAGFTVMIPQILTTFMLSAISAIVIPYRKKVKAIYEASPVSKYKLGPLPLMSLCGFIYFCFLATVLYYYFTNPALGARPELGTISFYLPIAIFVFAIVYFFAIRAYRKKQGIDIDLAFKELPPE